jgi:hypothetical protein
MGVCRSGYESTTGRSNIYLITSLPPLNYGDVGVKNELDLRKGKFPCFLAYLTALQDHGFSHNHLSGISSSIAYEL